MCFIYTIVPKGNTFSAVTEKSITMYTQSLFTNTCQVCDHHPLGTGQKNEKPTKTQTHKPIFKLI